MLRAVVAIVLGLLTAAAALGADTDARAAVERFLGRIGDANVTDVLIDQTFTLYDPAGRQPQSGGQQRVYMKLPRRQRVEYTLEGRREVRLTVGDRSWVRTAAGATYEAPATDARRERTHLLIPARRQASDVLAEWRALGVRDEVSHVTQVGGRAVTVVGARPGERDVAQVWVDPDRGVVRVVSRERLPRGETVLDVTFSEHRPVAGFPFPYRQETFMDGKLTLLVLVRSVVVNSGLADGLFDPDALKREK